MNPSRPPSLAVLAGAMLGAALATATPGLLFVAQAIDPRHGQVIALLFQLLIGVWGAGAGALGASAQVALWDAPAPAASDHRGSV